MSRYEIGDSPHALFICANFKQCGKTKVYDKLNMSDDFYCGSLYLDHVDFNITDNDDRCRFGCLIGDHEFGSYTQHLIPYKEE